MSVGGGNDGTKDTAHSRVTERKRENVHAKRSSVCDWITLSLSSLECGGRATIGIPTPAPATNAQTPPRAPETRQQEEEEWGDKTGEGEEGSGQNG